MKASRKVPFGYKFINEKIPQLIPIKPRGPCLPCPIVLLTNKLQPLVSNDDIRSLKACEIVYVRGLGFIYLLLFKIVRVWRYGCVN